MVLIQNSYIIAQCNIAQSFPVASLPANLNIDCRAAAAKAKLERKSLLKLAANRQCFPLYRGGRMIVQHPDYNNAR